MDRCASRRSPSAGRTRHVRDLLRAQLLEAEFSGERLPDEAHLMREYDASRNVVRSALGELQREGLIDRKQGAGTFPLRGKWRHSLVQAHGLASSIESSQLRMVTRVLGTEVLVAPPILAGKLDIPVGANCISVDTVTSIDGLPAVLLTSYLADTPAGGRLAEIVRGGIWAGDWYDALGDAGLPPCDRELVIEAVAVDSLVAGHLDVQIGAPAVRCERRLGLGESQIREYGFSYCRGDLVAFAVQDGCVSQDIRL